MAEPQEPHPVVLTDRELAVFDRVLAGRYVSEIATDLELVTDAVLKHLDNISEKLALMARMYRGWRGDFREPNPR
jgi:DNA-binding NarL/FixJ family response regulator